MTAPTPAARTRVLRALEREPLFEPFLVIVTGIGRGRARDAIRELARDGMIERAPEIGPQTWRLTDAGREELAQTREGRR